MKKFVAITMIGIVFLGFSLPVYVSDWDKAGKAFAIIDGLRVLTGGKIDVIEKLTRISNEPRKWKNRYRVY